MTFDPNSPTPCLKCGGDASPNRMVTKAKRYSSYMKCAYIGCGYEGPKVHNTSWPRWDDYEVAAMAWNDEYKIVKGA